MNRYYVIANWKMQLDVAKSRELAVTCEVTPHHFRPGR